MERPPLLRSLFRWVLSGLSAAVLVTPAIFLAPLSPRRAQTLGRWWSVLQQRIFDVEVTTEDRNGGRYPPGPKIFVMLNQTSLAEGIFSAGALPGISYRIFSNIEFLLIPFIGWAAWAGGAVMVRRGSPAHRKKALERAIELLRQGHTFYISIEGYRSGTGELLPYKSGPVRMALAAGARLYPIVVHGARAILPVGEWRVRPGHFHVVLLPEVSLEGASAQDVPAKVAELRAIAERELGRRSRG